MVEIPFHGLVWFGLFCFVLFREGGREDWGIMALWLNVFDLVEELRLHKLLSLPHLDLLLRFELPLVGAA